ncbi:MAG: hypothetical protein Tsb0018_02150 [Opitutales bacterium]
MKNKYLSVIVGLVLSLQSTFACGLCNQKDAACPYAVQYQLAVVFLSAMRGASLYYNAPQADDAENDTEEDTNLDDSESRDTEPQEPQLVYVIPENHFDQNDVRFMRAVLRAAENNRLIWAAEGMHFETEADGNTPRQTEGLAAFGTEDPFAYTLTAFVTARSLFNIDIIQWHLHDNQEYLASTLADIVEAMIAPENAAFMDAILNDPQLENNAMVRWVKRNKSPLLKKSAKDRTAFLMQAILAKNGIIRQAQPWKDLLTRGMAILFGQYARLPQHLQMPQQHLARVTNPATINLTVVTPILAYWRDLFIAENLVRLSDYATRQGRPLVFLVGGNHVNYINRLLSEREHIQTTSDPSSLPLDSNLTSSKKKRFAKK